jgi:glycosyltransferase involved in cell wall biosynthesis
MKIGFAGRWDPRDKKSWSGTYYYSYQQLKKYGDVEIFHFSYPSVLKNYLINFYKNPNKWLFRKQTAVEFLKPYAKYYSRQLSKAISKNKVDVLFAPAAPQLIAYLDAALPIVFMTDATFQQIQGYYDTWENFAPSNIQQGIDLDRRAFEKAAHCMLASDWCRQSAIKDYGVNHKKISVVPLGANIDYIPSVNELTFERSSCNLLFLGVEWKRKGGEIALQTFKILKQKGVNASLHIIGCVPPYPVNDRDVTIIPFLDKNIPADFERLKQILFSTDFLLLPTRAEAAGVVFCEASAYGVPSITADTGGVSTYVQNNVNGVLLSQQATESEYANVIAELTQDSSRVREFKYTSRELFEQELNWNRWGIRFHNIIDSL